MTPPVAHADHHGVDRDASPSGVRAPLFVRGSNPLTRRLLRAGLPIHELRANENDLEKLFFELTSAEGNRNTEGAA